MAMTNDAKTRGNVMITGASSGIGRACALYLDRRGFGLFAGVRKTSDADALKGAASTINPVILDVTDQRAVSSAAHQVEQALGERPLTGLVNNAGIAVGGPVEFLSLTELRRQLEINLIGQLAVTQAFMPLIRRSQGRIVNISSIGGRATTPFIAPYNASKFALEALSDCMRAELRPWGIKVAIVEPGSIQSSMWNKGRNEVDAVTRGLSAEGLRLYGAAIRMMQKLLEEQERMAIPAERVAKAVEHALTARRPRTRYLVGLDAKLMALLHWLLPDRIYDAALATMMRRLSGIDASPGDARSAASPP
jgi:NAD(P)-dependent dehydrogenase (short-subunit alcohol dehydrogenase family)